MHDHRHPSDMQRIGTLIMTWGTILVVLAWGLVPPPDLDVQRFFLTTCMPLLAGSTLKLFDHMFR